jgi:hypothetical protein
VRAPIVALSGPSAAGKSTTARELGEAFGWARLDEAYDRLRPVPSLTWSDERGLLRLELRLLAEEVRRYAEARRLSRAGRPVVADTSFLDPVLYTAGLRVRGLASERTFSSLIAEATRCARAGRLGLADLTVRLEVPRAVRHRRARGDPDRHPVRLRQRHEEVARAVARELVPLLLRGAEVVRSPAVRATGRAGTVAREVRDLARAVRPRREPERAAVRALAALERAVAAAGNLKKATPSRGPPR